MLNLLTKSPFDISMFFKRSHFIFKFNVDCELAML